VILTCSLPAEHPGKHQGVNRSITMHWDDVAPQRPRGSSDFSSGAGPRPL